MIIPYMYSTIDKIHSRNLAKFIAQEAHLEFGDLDFPFFPGF